MLALEAFSEEEIAEEDTEPELQANKASVVMSAEKTSTIRVPFISISGVNFFASTAKYSLTNLKQRLDSGKILPSSIFYRRNGAADRCTVEERGTQGMAYLTTRFTKEP